MPPIGGPDPGTGKACRHIIVPKYMAARSQPLCTHMAIFKSNRIGAIKLGAGVGKTNTLSLDAVLDGHGGTGGVFPQIFLFPMVRC